MCPLNNPSISNARISRSTYTGNDSGAERQITIGWVPKFVMIMERSTSKMWITNNSNKGFQLLTTPTIGMYDVPRTHATDGFTVGSAGNIANSAGLTYDYVAIG